MVSKRVARIWRDGRLLGGHVTIAGPACVERSTATGLHPRPASAALEAMTIPRHNLPMRIAFVLGLAATVVSGEVAVPAKHGAAGIERARDSLRASRRPGTARIQAGDYLLDHSLEFGSRDPEGSVYIADPEVRLIGGARVRGWRPVSDKAVLALLSVSARRNAMVATVAGLGAFQARGFGHEHMPAHSELFFNGKRMTVSRWPNVEFTRIAEASDTDPEDDGHGRRIGRLPFGFRYAGDRPSGWKNAPDIWVHGY